MRLRLSAPLRAWRLRRTMSGTNLRNDCACGGLPNFIFRSIAPINWRVGSMSFSAAPGSVAGRVPSPAPKGSQKRAEHFMLERVLQEIRARRRFVVTSHARPDGDGIGSALA